MTILCTSLVQWIISEQGIHSVGNKIMEQLWSYLRNKEKQVYSILDKYQYAMRADTIFSERMCAYLFIALFKKIHKN